MAKAKTAISIDDHLLEETANLAQDLNVSRSRLVSLALEDFIRRHRNKKLLTQINQAYAHGPDSEETATLEMMQSHQKKLVEREEWK